MNDRNTDSTSDRNVEQLVRMALDIEALERAAGAAGDEFGPVARIGRPAPRHGSWRKVGVGVGFGTAAAACLTLAMFMMQPRNPGSGAPLAVAPRVPSVPIPVEPDATPRVVQAANNDEKCVVMAMFRGADGQCSCLQMRDGDFEEGRTLAEVPRSELYDVALHAPCSTSAQQVLIVAVSGRADSLPTNHEQAEAIVRQISTAAASVGRHADVSAIAYAAMPGLSPGSTVIAENVAMRQVSQARQLAPEGTWR